MLFTKHPMWHSYSLYTLRHFNADSVPCCRTFMLSLAEFCRGPQWEVSRSMCFTSLRSHNSNRPAVYQCNVLLCMLLEHCEWAALETVFLNVCFLLLQVSVYLADRLLQVLIRLAVSTAFWWRKLAEWRAEMRWFRNILFVHLLEIAVWGWDCGVWYRVRLRTVQIVATLHTNYNIALEGMAVHFCLLNELTSLLLGGDPVLRR
jgi:hypothetical protein